MVTDKSETQKHLKDRLERLGWWSKAIKIREKAKKDAIATNPDLTPQDAAKIGWQAIRDEFPLEIPARNVPGPTAAAAIDAGVAADQKADRDATADKPPSTKKEDFEWVYQNIANGEAVNYDTCPGDGARGLLEWAKDKKDKFYDLFLAKFINKNDDGINRKNDGPTDLIDELLRQRAEGLRGEPALSPLDPDAGGGGQESAGPTLDGVQP